MATLVIIDYLNGDSKLEVITEGIHGALGTILDAYETPQAKMGLIKEITIQPNYP